MAEPFLAEIRPWACNFAPHGWATCDGQLMPISQNSALFSIIGVQFGGDGKATFGLPNLQGRVPVGAGAGPGLTPRTVGDSGGAETVTLTVAELPEHAHALGASTGRPQSQTPSAASVMCSAAGAVYSTAAPDAKLAPEAISTVSGGGGPHNNVMPYQAVNFCIALEGVYPNRS